MTRGYYGEDLALVHEAGFGDFARSTAPNLIARLKVGGVRRGARIVEFGCGAGAATRPLTMAGYEVLGLDASSEMIRLARKNVPKARFIVGRLPHARIPACEAVVAVGEVLNYMPRRSDFDLLLRRVYAALRPGGLFLFDAKLPSGPSGPVTRGRFARDWAVLATASEDGRGRLTLLSAPDLSKRLRAAVFFRPSEPGAVRGSTPVSTRKHILLSCLAVGALAALFVQRRCAAPIPVVTGELWRDRDAWTGRNVEVVGELKSFSPGTADEHAVIEDDGFRVGLRGRTRPEPRTLLGHRVRARGVFVFTEKTGGYLESAALTPAELN
ncbi:MAG: class I SAM-dependent methyltransferase [Elusimicrobiota bacterium]